MKGLSEWEEKHTSLVCVGLFLVSLLGTYFSSHHVTNENNFWRNVADWIFLSLLAVTLTNMFLFSVVTI